MIEDLKNVLNTLVEKAVADYERFKKEENKLPWRFSVYNELFEAELKEKK